MRQVVAVIVLTQTKETTNQHRTACLTSSVSTPFESDPIALVQRTVAQILLEVSRQPIFP
jgi:hypothetical protein